MKICTICKQEKPISEFNKRVRSKDGLQNVCRECNRDRSRLYYKKNREKQIEQIYASKQKRVEENRVRLIEFLSSKSCVDCGYDDIRALEFDHVQGSKVDDVSRLLQQGYSWETIKAEIDKCELVCRNCHAIRTQVRADTYKQKYFRPDSG